MKFEGVVRGAVAWATLPRVRLGPMRRWQGDGLPPETIDPVELARRLRENGGDACTLLVDVSLRPVVLLQDRPRGVLEDTLALTIVSLVGLTENQQQAVRDQQEPSLFHLPARQAKYGFTDEMAVDLNGLLRIGCEALLPRSVGILDDNEMRVIGERLVAHLDIDLDPVIAREIEDRLQQLTGPEML